MNTPAHVIIGAAVFARRERPAVTAAAFAGGLLPDLSLYLMAGWAILGQGIAPRVVFDELYFSQAWQAVFRVDQSIPLWGVVLALALWRGRPALAALAGAAVLHLLLDLPFHAADARPHFWPLTDWVFVSPVSYWDDARSGQVVGTASLTAVCVLAAILVVRLRGHAARAATLALVGMELATSGFWRWLL